MSLNACNARIAWLWATYPMTAHAPSKHSKSVLEHSKSVLDCMWENTQSQCLFIRSQYLTACGKRVAASAGVQIPVW